MGVDKMYSTSTPSYFLSSIDGELATTTATSTYVSRTDSGSFNNYNFNGSQWTVTDKNGVQYQYGYASSTQQSNPSTGNIYKWMLQQQTDASGNSVSYSYYQDGGQIYPSSITYTNNASSTGIFEVDFLRESRSDNASSSLPDFGWLPIIA